VRFLSIILHIASTSKITIPHHATLYFTIMVDENPANSDRVDTVNDISKACHMALSILNDLLNYDKLEDGTLLIEPMRVVALPFILNCTEVLHLQAKEKGLRLTFDLEDKDDIGEKNLDGMRDPEYPHFGCLSDMDAFACTDISPTQMSCLSDSDYINVDPYKMNQVIGNLISNAIKFTPAGQSVTVKARKFVPDTRWSSYPASHQSSQVEMSLSEDSRSNSYLRKIQEYFTFSSSGKKSDKAKKSEKKDNKKDDDVHDAGKCLRSSAFLNFAPNNSGFLILEVIDSGVGMAPEDSKRLFKEIVQFNPSKLQVIFATVHFFLLRRISSLCYLKCLVLSCLVLSCLVLSCLVLSYLILSYLTLPHLILSYLISY
jgi:signal transduction histidine kinase